MSLPGALAGHRIIPVVVIDDASLSADVVAALVAGGIGCAEITLRTPSVAERLQLGTRCGAFACLNPDWESAPTRKDLSLLDSTDDPVVR
jgi:hypothetical protein